MDDYLDHSVGPPLRVYQSTLRFRRTGTESTFLIEGSVNSRLSILSLYLQYCRESCSHIKLSSWNTPGIPTIQPKCRSTILILTITHTATITPIPTAMTMTMTMTMMIIRTHTHTIVPLTYSKLHLHPTNRPTPGERAAYAWSPATAWTATLPKRPACTVLPPSIPPVSAPRSCGQGR